MLTLVQDLEERARALSDGRTTFAIIFVGDTSNPGAMLVSSVNIDAEGGFAAALNTIDVAANMVGKRLCIVDSGAEKAA